MICLNAQNVNISGGSVFDGEPFVIVNPQNPQNIVIAWMGYKWLNKIVIKSRSSFDGGDSWSQAIDMGHDQDGFTSADPSMAFDKSGNLFLTYVDYNKEEAVGGVFIRKSSDGGLTWQQQVKVIDMDDDPAKKPIDRPWVAIDTSDGVYQGYIYVTTMNAKGAQAQFHPYLSRSFDGGQTWEPWSYIDDIDWYSGSIIMQPMPTPIVSSQGGLSIIYPSWVFTQNFLPQYLLANSTDGGDTFAYNTVFESDQGVSDSLAKKGYLIKSNPVDPQNMVFVYLSKQFGDADIVLIETTDGGNSWSDAIRLNDDEAASGKMQDMLWASYDIDGDLIVCWRDRRNSPDTGYIAASEFYAAFRDKDSVNFSSNFSLSDSIISYHDILSLSGNDFMCIDLKNDTLNAVRGEARDDQSLNIWFQRMDVDEGIVSLVRKIANESVGPLVYPVPADNYFKIESKNINSFQLYDLNGSLLLNRANAGEEIMMVDTKYFESGVYVLKVYSVKRIYSSKIIIKH
jgi:hypothetical protein